MLRRHLAENGAILDLMSSWRFHIPMEHLTPKRWSAWDELDEMVNNPAISDGDVWVHNLNQNPKLPFADGEFDVVCAVSVQYLTQPLEVFAEVYRVLKPEVRLLSRFRTAVFQPKQRPYGNQRMMPSMFSS